MLNRPLRIIVGITGGIAAYKSLSLIRLLKKNGAEVKVVATRHALEFVTPLTLQTLSQNAIYSQMFPSESKVDVEHIQWATWADAMVVAPATANIIGKFAHGIADDALSTLYLASTCPIFVAPAMNENMWHHPAVQDNLRVLQGRGVKVISPASGFLACGSSGDGRMKEPEEIASAILQFFAREQKFIGKKALVTAGPTYEPIDPVRFIGNYSSGLMGFRLAEELSAEGAEVTLVTGPTALTTTAPRVQIIHVKTAQQMLDICQKTAPTVDLMIMAAAVADYTPENVAPEKIKKSDNQFVLHLKKTADILSELGHHKMPHQCVVGFALETENELDNAFSKLKNKNADIIVLNSLRDKGAGFQCQTNVVNIIDRKGNITPGTLKDKQEVAADIVAYIADYMLNNNTNNQ